MKRPLWHGRQLAVDAALVSPVGRDVGSPAAMPALACCLRVPPGASSDRPTRGSANQCRLVAEMRVDHADQRRPQHVMGSPSSRRAKVAFARAARRKRRETYRSSYAPDAVVSSCLASRPPGDGVRWPRPSPASGAALEWHGGSRRCARSCCSTRTFTSCYSLGHADFVARPIPAEMG